MKRIGVTSFLLLFALLCHSQPLSGSYILQQPNSNRAEGYSFSDNGQFSWFRFSSTNKEFGRGTYSLSNNTITFNFQTAQRQFDIQVAESELNQSGFCNVEVRALHSNGQPLSGLKVILEKSNVVETTNNKGQASIEIRQPVDTDKIIFELDGVQTPWKTFPLKGVDLLFALVVDDNIRYRENETITSDFKKTNKSIVLSSQASFRKVSERQFLKFRNK